MRATGQNARSLATADRKAALCLTLVLALAFALGSQAQSGAVYIPRRDVVGLPDFAPGVDPQGNRQRLCREKTNKEFAVSSGQTLGLKD